MSSMLFICSRSGQRDWWRSYSIEIVGYEPISLRSGEGQWLRVDDTDFELRVHSGQVERVQEIFVGDSVQKAVCISGDAKYVFSHPREITVGEVTADFSTIPILDWRVAGYTPVGMLFGYSLYFGIFVILMGIIFGVIIARGPRDLFMLIWLPAPLLSLDIFLRSFVSLVVSSRTRAKMQSVITESGTLPHRTSMLRLILGLTAIAACVVTGCVIDHLKLPWFASIPALLLLLAAIVSIGRWLRSHHRFA